MDFQSFNLLSTMSRYFRTNKFTVEEICMIKNVDHHSSRNQVNNSVGVS